jgi:hypothetical protein
MLIVQPSFCAQKPHENISSTTRELSYIQPRCLSRASRVLEYHISIYRVAEQMLDWHIYGTWSVVPISYCLQQAQRLNLFMSIKHQSHLLSLCSHQTREGWLNFAKTEGLRCDLLWRLQYRRVARGFGYVYMREIQL